MHWDWTNDCMLLKLLRQHLPWFLVCTRLARIRVYTTSFVLFPCTTILWTRRLKIWSIGNFLPVEYRMSGMLAAHLVFLSTSTIAKSSSITCSLSACFFVSAAYSQMQLLSWIITLVAGIINAILQPLWPVISYDKRGSRYIGLPCIFNTSKFELIVLWK